MMWKWLEVLLFARYVDIHERKKERLNMKLIEAMKKIKDLQVKADDLRDKVGKNHALLNYETPAYGKDQRERVSGWIQAHSDILDEILHLRVAIQRTNLRTNVKIELGGKTVEKLIASWIHRRRDLANEEGKMWAKLTDKGLKEGAGQDSSGQKIDVKIIRFYDPDVRDEAKELYRSEPMKIDSTLEVTNAITDLVE